MHNFSLLSPWRNFTIRRSFIFLESGSLWAVASRHMGPKMDREQRPQPRDLESTRGIGTSSVFHGIWDICLTAKTGSGIKILTVFGIKDQHFGQKYGISYEEIYLVGLFVLSLETNTSPDRNNYQQEQRTKKRGSEENDDNSSWQGNFEVKSIQLCWLCREIAHNKKFRDTKCHPLKRNVLTMVTVKVWICDFFVVIVIHPSVNILYVFRPSWLTPAKTISASQVMIILCTDN